MLAESSILELVETADGVAIADRLALSPARSQEVIDFEELLSELITIARMLRPYLGSRLVSALLTDGVRRRTLSCEESDAGVDC